MANASPSIEELAVEWTMYKDTNGRPTKPALILFAAERRLAVRSMRISAAFAVPKVHAFVPSSNSPIGSSRSFGGMNLQIS